MNFTNIKQAIVLNDKQDKFLNEQTQGFPRQRALYTFRSLASLTDSHYEKKGFSADLTVGQFVISTTELAQLWKCDRKTAISVIDDFNRLGFLVSISNNRTTLHSIQCIVYWSADELPSSASNPFFSLSPVCLTKEQRTALSQEVMGSRNGRDAGPLFSREMLDGFVSRLSQVSEDII